MKRFIHYLLLSLVEFWHNLVFRLRCKEMRILLITEVIDFDRPNLYFGPPEKQKHIFKYGLDYTTLEAPNGKNVSIGFSPGRQKWYGWSHRAIYGFGIGSTIKAGDLGFIPKNRAEYIESLRQWYDEPEHFDLEIKELEFGIQIEYTLSIDSPRPWPKHRTYLKPLDITYGKGEWTAETLEDAKQMAIDFAHSVS